MKLIRNQLDQADEIAKCDTKSVAWKDWVTKNESIVENLFGVDSIQAERLRGIKWGVAYPFPNTPQSDWDQAFQNGLTTTEALLRALVSEIENFWSDSGASESTNGKDEVIRLLQRFHHVSRQLRARHADRETLNVNDEYDVQDLLHALLRLYFDDVRPEEWTPSYAGGCARMDFLLAEPQIVVEVKMSRKGMTAKTLGDELLVDIARYRAHPGLKMLFCFIYDPQGLIRNPNGLERDLSRTADGLEVLCHISPK